MGEMDIYGHGVNMASRLASLAKPGEIVVSADVVSEFTPDLDARVEDMGDCYVKNVEEPIRAYRITPPGAEPVRLGPVELAAMLPSIAVIPLRDGGDLAVGEVLAEELIRALSQSDRINVTSRLSTRAFRSGERTAREIGRHLGSHYVLSGRCSIAGGQVQVSLELVETRTEQVVWADSLRSTLRSILLGGQELISRTVAEVGQAIHQREFRRAKSLALPNLESYSLLLGAINGMYRLSRRDFERSGAMLEHLIDREPRQPLPLAWLGNWHVLKVQQGWIDDTAREGSKARARTERALDLDPENDQALTIDGWVHTHLTKDFDAAGDRFRRAIAANPSASMAWLLNGMMHGFRGEGEASVEMCLRARSLSPLDPQRFFYECLLSSAYLTAGRWQDAEDSAQTSLRLNANHTSTLRCLAIAQYKLNKHDEARETVQKLTLLEPKLTVEAWQSNNPSATFEHGKEFAGILQDCGLPER